MNKKLFFKQGSSFLVAIIMVLFLAVVNVQAGDKYIRSDFVLRYGEEIDGDVTILGGDVEFEQNSVIDGDLAILGGYVTLSGIVEGDVAILGGEVVINETADISGDFSSVTDNVTIMPGALIDGNQITREGTKFDIKSKSGSTVIGKPDIDHTMNEVKNMNMGIFGVFASIFGLFTTITMFFLYVLLFTGVAAIANVLIENHLKKAAVVIKKRTLLSFGFGLGVTVLIPFLIIFLSITIILIPVAILVALAFLAALLYGWITIGSWLGHLLGEKAKLDWSSTALAATGVFLITLISGLLNKIPCIGWIPGAIVLVTGLGAVLIYHYDQFKKDQNTRRILEGSPAPYGDEIIQEGTTPQNSKEESVTTKAKTNLTPTEVVETDSTTTPEDLEPVADIQTVDAVSIDAEESGTTEDDTTITSEELEPVADIPTVEVSVPETQQETTSKDEGSETETIEPEANDARKTDNQEEENRGISATFLDSLKDE